MPINAHTDKENVGYIFVMEYYSATKKKKILHWDSTEDLESIMLSSTSQTTKVTSAKSHLRVESKKTWIHKKENQLVAARTGAIKWGK